MATLWRLVRGRAATRASSSRATNTARRRAKIARLPFHKEHAWEARALDDGRDLADAFLRLRAAVQKLIAELQDASRRANPSAPTPALYDDVIHKPVHKMTNRFIHALVDLVMEAIRCYPTHLRYLLVPHLLGAFIHGLIARDCEHFSVNGGSTGNKATQRRSRER